MKFLMTLLIGMVAGLPATLGQTSTLNVSNIPQELLKNAHSVIREETYQFNVNDIGEAMMEVHQVITVLDAEGKSRLDFVKFSSDFQKLWDADIRVFDARGSLVNRYKMKELGSESIGEGLVPDGKMYYFRVTAPSYPMTVEYDYVVKYKGTLSYPIYGIQGPDQSVQQSSFTASVPLSLGIRYKSKNIHLNPEVSSDNSKKTYKWSVQNIKAIPEEEGAADENADYPMVLLAPNKFSMDGYEGDLSSWKTFGNWYESLSSGAHDLSEETKATLQKMVAGISDKKLKVRILYHYLQKNFRYVNINLGIGGYKPLNASYVEDKKYGDCKALSNYMQACLAAIGIPSYQALVNAGYNSQPVDSDFPINGFDHVILCVPMKKDSIWLECTSNITAFDQLGSFTENRYALLITPSGGVLVHTPKSRATENSFSSLTTVDLSDDGSGSYKSAIHISGEYRELMIHYVLGEDKDAQKKFLVRYLGYKQPDDFLITQPSGDDSNSITLTASQERVPEFMAGSKMFLNPRLYKIWNDNLPRDTSRSMPYYLDCPFDKTDTTLYRLPANYTVETLPEDRDDSFPLGSYHTHYVYDEKSNTVTTYAQLEIYAHVIQPKYYAAALKFFSDVVDEYTEKIVVAQK
ncbi:MAG: DUF3857 domain-containing protein [Bacteroidota bacterium]|nr:DUF3857 domain-containing protein [Bacteroidota bacterium]